MFCLPYANKSFNVVIVSNALHIVPQPEKAIAEIKRVLKDDGVLIAPTFTHAENSFTGMVRAFFYEDGRLPSPQQVDERGIPALSAAKRLGGAEKRCSESVISVNLYRMCEIGGVIRYHFFENTRKPIGLGGKLWLP